RKTAHLARAPKADVLFDLLCTELARLAEELDGLGVERLRADAARPSRARSGLVRYRGALMTALLLACPERRGAATELLCSDLAPDLTDLTYRAATTKADLDNPQPVPVELRPHLRRWLALRAAFAPRHDRLWIRLQKGIGAPAGPDTIYREIKATLQRVAGIKLWPNLLRDLGSTFAREELHHVPHLASSVLNHQDPRTTRIYTEQAKDTAALKAAQGAMARAVEAVG